MREPNLTMIMVTSQDWGGVQAYVLDLAKAIKIRGLPVMVCAGNSKLITRNSKLQSSDSRVTSYKLQVTGNELGDKCREEEIEFIELKHMIRDINPISNLRALLELISLFKKYRPRVVHLNSSMMGVVGSMAAKIADIQRVVYCIGGWAFNEQISVWKKRFYILAERISARWKDVIICVHPGDERLALFLKIKPREKLMTIPNGIDVYKFQSQLLNRDSARAALFPLPFPPSLGERARDRGVVIGTVANAYPPKNLLWYLDVCKTITSTHPEFQIVIIGEGVQFNELKAKHQKLGLGDRVILTGKRMDAGQLYSAFDIFVSPSTKEGMPITILEAMAAKVPCVATDVGGCKWMLENGEAGMIVRPNDANALINAIEKLAQNLPLREQLGKRAFEIVKTRFDLQNTVDRTIATLNLRVEEAVPSPESVARSS